MNEINKTITLAILGVALSGLGYALLPRTISVDSTPDLKQPLFPELKDGNVAKGLEIIDKNKEPFEVKQVGDRWVLPSHQNYPADAKQQIINASTTLVGLKANGIETDKSADHALYGVVEPTVENRKNNVKGLGKQITFKDATGKALANLVIGNSAQKLGSKESDSNLRYVRRVGQGQDQVYIVKLPNDKFSGKFEDWIETDLLKLDPFMVTQVSIRDYSGRLFQTAQGGVAPDSIDRMNIDLNYNDKESKWTIGKIEEFDENSGEPKPFKLDGVEPNSAKLNDLRNALRDLKIVNVKKKPQELIDGLNKKLTRESIGQKLFLELIAKGFYPRVNPEDKSVTLFAKEGEVISRLNNGVEYKLMFGEIAGAEDDNAAKTDEAKPMDEKKPEADKPSSDNKFNRYIMVEARFNPNLIAKPELEKVPDPLPGTEPAPMDKPADNKPTDKPMDKPGDADNKEAPPMPSEPKATDKPAKPAPATVEPAKEPATPKADSKQSDTNKENPFRNVAFQKEGEAGQGTDKPATDAKPDQPKTDAKAEQPMTDPAAKPMEQPKAEANPMLDNEAKQALEFERKRIIEANTTKQKEYDEKIKSGEQLAKQLNSRFSEWYYVIPDDVYKKIHLGKADVISLPDAGIKPASPFNIPGLQGPGGGSFPGFPPKGR
jgi:hypothetical protein